MLALHPQQQGILEDDEEVEGQAGHEPHVTGAYVGDAHTATVGPDSGSRGDAWLDSLFVQKFNRIALR